VKWVLPIGALLALALSAGRASAADADCGAALAAPVRAVWLGLDGAGGRLGCPVSAQAAAARSPAGVVGLETDFAGGAVIAWPDDASGVRAYAVYGCIWRLWFQFGGPSGWLGLPTSQARNTPDGQRQSFEGGEARFTRATNTCEAEKAR
jgi:uncharacterized protein with LGFP repeats